MHLKFGDAAYDAAMRDQAAARAGAEKAKADEMARNVNARPDEWKSLPVEARPYYKPASKSFLPLIASGIAAYFLFK